MPKNPSTSSTPVPAEGSVPREPLGKLFLRFLKFGSLAWGGPVAQIGMIQQELVEEERWISPEQFRRALAVYQVLPGPEAHELCVYFGMLSRGRVGGLLAGLGFMLPGFVLMFALSWWYSRFGLDAPVVRAAFGTVQAAVAALIVRAVFRIGSHCCHDRWSASIAGLAAGAQLAGVHFALPLLAGGLFYWLAQRGRHRWAASLIVVAVVSLGAWFCRPDRASAPAGFATPPTTARSDPSLGALAWSGLRSGSLTFGGAYTVIPFLQQDAVVRGGWMTNAEFLDGLALSGMLPAPLIIFATFVGYLGGGWAGALALTLGIFAPAFAFTLIGHGVLERILHRPTLKSWLEGVTAAVVGLIAATALQILAAVLTQALATLVFVAALAALFRWSSKLLVPVIIAASALVGLLVS
ncbi:MAG: chromate efflux transporter [Thermoanaerobaculia bacterium]|nr:chromate efflux transporter [Thermoanaerobaculia bacterium]